MKIITYDLVYETTNIYIYICLIGIVGIALLGLNYLIASQDPDPLKKGPFECGLSSFNQSRVTFSVLFVLVAILFLPFDLEVSSVLPIAVSIYHIEILGLIILTFFFIILTIGFVFEIYKEALKIHSKQDLGSTSPLTRASLMAWRV